MISIVVDKIIDNRVEVANFSDINHIKNVFRKNVGDEIRVVDGKNEYICSIEIIEADRIILKVLSITEDNKTLEIDITAAISLLKNDKMDLTIQKLTELGIKKIIPVSAKRSVVKLDKKKDKWDVIVRETLKQCKGIKATEVSEITKIDKISYSDYDLIIVPYENEENVYLKNILKKLKEIPKKILYIIGPEGGFEEKEIEFLKKNNANVISLGKRILRAETAAIVTGGILINEFQ